MLFVLVAFVLDEFFGKKYNQDTLQYNLLNIFGAGMLIIYGLSLKGWPFVILNSIWAIAALVKGIKIIRKRY